MVVEVKRFCITGEKITARYQKTEKRIDQLLLCFGREIDHDVSAEDNIKLFIVKLFIAAFHAGKRLSVHNIIEIQATEPYQPFYLVFNDCSLPMFFHVPAGIGWRDPLQ